MSDANRKDLSDSTSSFFLKQCQNLQTLTSIPEVADKVTPDNSKSTTEKVKDTVTGTVDKVQRFVIPAFPFHHYLRTS